MNNHRTTVAEILFLYQTELSELYSRDEIRQLAYWLFDHRLHWNKATVQLSRAEFLPEEHLGFFISALHKLKSSWPIQYIIGEAWFNGRRFYVDQRVLIPRPETEELCAIIANDAALIESAALNILDIGTGSGCIAIDLCLRLPGSAVTAIDISSDALQVARGNAILHGCAIEFIQADILNQASLWQGTREFDIVVSNPPYIPDEEYNTLSVNVLGHEPAMALRVPNHDPLVFYRLIAARFKDHLRRGGYLYFEINEKYGMEICRLMQFLGYQRVELMRDLNNKDRFVRVALKRA